MKPMLVQQYSTVAVAHSQIAGVLSRPAKIEAPYQEDLVYEGTLLGPHVPLF